MAKPKINWLNHIIELIVVFIGITLAFMLNSWREDAKNNQLENQYLNSFYDEIKYSNARLDTIIQINKTKIEYLNKSIELLKSDNLPEDSTLIVISHMVQISLFIPKTITYESIKNSGNLNIIENYEIRSKIIGFYESIKGIALVEEYYKLYINDYIIPYFFDNIDILNLKIVNKKGIASHKINNLIMGYYQLLIQVVNTYEEILEMNKSLILMLEAEGIQK